jgi:hypothetical protein
MELEGALAFPLFMTGFVSMWIVGMDSGDTCFLKKLSEKVNGRWNAQLWNDVAARARSVLGAAAIVLLAAAVVVNGCTWMANGIFEKRSVLIPINIGVAIVSFSLVMLERWRWRMFGSRKFVFSVPRWSKAVLAAILVYIASDLVFDGVRSYREQLGSNSPGGKIQLELSAEQKSQNQRRVVRHVSNVWILLCSISAAGLLFVKHEECAGPFGKYNSVVQKIE